MDVIFLLRFLCYHNPNSLSFIVAGSAHSQVYTKFFEIYGRAQVRKVSEQEQSGCKEFPCVRFETIEAATLSLSRL
jgi:hypothetical protein